MAVSERGEVTAYPPAEVMTSPANRPAWAAGVPQTTPLTSAPVPAGAMLAGAAAVSSLMQPLPPRAGAVAVRKEHAEEGGQADLDPGALAAGRDLPGDGHGLVDGDGVAGVDGVPAGRGVDPDHPAVGAGQRPAGIARPDVGAGLHHAVQRLVQA